MVCVGGVGEVVAHVDLVVGIGEVVDPGSGVGVDVDDAGVDEVVEATQGAGDGLVDDLPVEGNVGGVFGNHYFFSGAVIASVCGLLYPVELSLPAGCLCRIEPLVAKVELRGVEHSLSRDGVGDVEAVDGCLLLFGIAAPGDGDGPVEARCDRIAVFIFGNLVEVVARIARVGNPFADDGVAHPVDKLLVL